MVSHDGGLHLRFLCDTLPSTPIVGVGVNNHFNVINFTVYEKSEINKIITFMFKHIRLLLGKSLDFVRKCQRND